MSETEDTGEIDVTIETEVIDFDGDGVADAVVETTTTIIDVDGDGVADIVDESTITAVDLDGDGAFSDDEIEIEETTAVREDLVED